MAKITEPTDDQLRAIARAATGTGYYSGGVKALRAVWDAARRVPVAERMPEDVQTLVDEVADGWSTGFRNPGIWPELARDQQAAMDATIEAAIRYGAQRALEAAYSQKGADRDPR